MAGSEGVVAVDIGHLGQGLSELLVPLLFAWIESHVFQDQDAAGRQLLDFRLRIGTNRIGGERNGLAQQFAEPHGGRTHAVLGGIRGGSLRDAQGGSSG